MLLKICGTTNVQDAQQALDAGANALGFIFAPSKRRIPVQAAAAITRTLPADCLKVGIFTDPDAAEILHTVREAQLSAVQLHFPYHPGVIAELTAASSGPLQLWQVVGVELEPSSPDASDAELRLRLQQASADPRIHSILLDSSRSGTSGGLGLTFPWARVRRVLNQISLEQTPLRPRLILAGGLTPRNVREAIATLRPGGVDVVSGVEAEPGRKDPEKVAAFLQAAREASRALPPRAQD